MVVLLAEAATAAAMVAMVATVMATVFKLETSLVLLVPEEAQALVSSLEPLVLED